MKQSFVHLRNLKGLCHDDSFQALFSCLVETNIISRVLCHLKGSFPEVKPIIALISLKEVLLTQLY